MKPTAVALLSDQGTACVETALYTHPDTPENYRDTPENRAAIEASIQPGPDAPVPGTWTDVTDNPEFEQ